MLFLNLAKRLTEKQKEEIKINFLANQSVEFLSEKFNCTKITEIKYLKRKNIWRARCFQYIGNRKYRLYGVRFILKNEIEGRA